MIKEVEKSLPPKNERILRVEMTPLQKQYYKVRPEGEGGRGSFTLYKQLGPGGSSSTIGYGWRIWMGSWGKRQRDGWLRMQTCECV